VSIKTILVKKILSYQYLYEAIYDANLIHRCTPGEGGKERMKQDPSRQIFKKLAIKPKIVNPQ
jgi:hypothetical protein